MIDVEMYFFVSSKFFFYKNNYITTIMRLNCWSLGVLKCVYSGPV